MNDSLLMILKLLPILLLLSLGFLLKKTGFISKAVISGMTKLVLNITLPCVLFLSFVRADLELDLLVLSGMVFVVCLLTFGAGFWIKRLQKTQNPFYPSVFTTFLTGPVGFPLFVAYFGSENLYKLAILDIGNSIFIFTVLSAFLSTVSCGETASLKKRLPEHLKNLAHSPLTISIFAGLAISLTGVSVMLENLPPIQTLFSTMDLLSQATFPLTLLIVGYELPFHFRHLGRTFYAVLIRLAMMLTLAWLMQTFVIDRWFGLDRIYQAAVITLFILPPPFIIPLSIVGECEHKDYVLEYISLHLLVSLVAFFVWISWFGI